MKNIWKYLIICFVCFLTFGCDKEHVHQYIEGICECGEKDPNYVEEKTYKVTLVIDDEIKDYIDIETENEVKENEEFILPHLKVEDQHSRYYIGNYSESNILVREVFNNYSIKGWWCEEKSELFITHPQRETTITIDQDLTFVLRYSVYETDSEYEVLMHKNYGTIQEEIKFIGDTMVLPIMTKEQCDFDGWYKTSNFSGDVVTEIDFSTLNKTLILHSKYSISIDYVNGLIDALPENPTCLDIDAIELAYSKYELVPEEKLDRITNSEKILTLNSLLKSLKQVRVVYNRINTILNSEVTPSLKNQILYVQEQLETMDSELLKYLPDFDEKRLNEISEEIEQILALYEEDAKAFDLNVITIPIYMEQYYSEKITGLYEEYQTYDKELKDLITTYDKLETLYNNLMEIEKSTDTIYYLNSGTISNVYTSKEQLCEAFFTDFYYYIVAYHGTEHLEKNYLFNVNNFVELSQDFTGAGANNLYGIGNIAGRYMLTKDINGILENQSDNGFFGFCYKYGLYEDLLPFFINFFAYWRIDEKYANTSNYGADIFAESWAPTVDIAKFFYYDENTSYVRTDRMIDCLTYTASVVYGLDEDPMNIRLRGYKFAGWYDNPEFNGSAITNLNGHKKLYAKWVEDEKQQDEDAANLVDVYIYNLTTKKAVVNVTTVGYVKDMYDALSDNAKALVKNYSTLKEYIKNNQ